MPRRECEILVVGAGAAGIACARLLRDAGRDVQVVEARPAIGGRIRSVVESHDGTAIELGAEFIHGAPRSLLGWMRQLELDFYDVQDEHLWRHAGNLVPARDFWARIDQVLKTMARSTAPDHSVHEALEIVARSRSREASLARSFIEGFHAADLHELGTRGLADATDADDETLNGCGTFRIRGPYDAVVQKAALVLGPCVHPRTVVEHVRWAPGDVVVTCRTGMSGVRATWRAHKLVLTVPLAVLASGAIAFDPWPAELKSALAGLRMGHVQRITFVFQGRFWEALAKRPVSFLHAAAGTPFPTWWTLAPMRSNHLVAWQGGPLAEQMAAWTEDARVEAALGTLSVLTGRSVRWLRAHMVGAYTHNWSRDPFALGAYSYVGVHGLRPARRLRRPFEDTIYVAGEATASGASRGTVHGAIESGERAARQLLMEILPAASSPS